MSSTGESHVVIVLTTLGADQDAAGMARTLVEEKLAACVSVLPPMSSTYRWNGVIETAQEQQLLIKTEQAQVSAIAARFRTLHPYEVPEFIVVQPADVSESYGRWVIEAVG